MHQAHSETAAVYNPGNGPSPNLPALCYWDFLASRTVRNKRLLFKPPSLWHFVIVAQAKTVPFLLNSTPAS